MLLRLWRSPFLLSVLGIALVAGLIWWQHHKIKQLSAQYIVIKEQLSTLQKTHAKTLQAFNDKGEKDNDRFKFMEEANRDIAARNDTSAPSPVLRDAYKRVRDRIQNTR